MKKRLLICEDDKDIVELLTVILKDNYDVKSAEKIDDIVTLVQAMAPDVILMDLWIPSIGGEEAILRLKGNSDTQAIPVILISASDKIAEVYKKTKADAYISKPFSLNDCRMLISKFSGN